jgi:hypothetical protein
MTTWFVLACWTSSLVELAGLTKKELGSNSWAVAVTAIAAKTAHTESNLQFSLIS